MLLALAPYYYIKELHPGGGWYGDIIIRDGKWIYIDPGDHLFERELDDEEVLLMWATQYGQLQ